MHRNNCHRDLQRKLGVNGIAVAPLMQISLSLWDSSAKPRATKIDSHYPVLLPHELLGMMHEKNQLEFDVFVRGTEPLTAFWNHVPPTHPWLAGSPILSTPRCEQRVIPLRLHGDGVHDGQSKGRTLDVISISSLTGDKAPPGTGSGWSVPSSRQPSTNAMVMKTVPWALYGK